MLNRIVILNSTPIIALSSVRKLELLKKLYGKVYIPEAVYNEVIIKQESKAKNDLMQADDWIITKKVTNQDAKQLFKVHLHEGEVEVILLGQELKANLLIIDDYMAREYAKYMDFKITGSLGVLLKSKENGEIDRIKPVVDDLISNGIYIGNKLYNDVLKLAQEN